MRMARKSTVWMVHGKTSLAGVKGTLQLDDRVLLFVPEGGRAAETVLPLRSIVRVRRARVTPVLEVGVELPNAPSIIGFYFIEPPHLARAGSGAKFLERFLTKRRAVINLQVANSAKGDEVDFWVSAIRSAKAETLD